ncbi:MAG: putative hydrolase of the HAD superfamily [Chlamydiales bacterium]|jgi:putative hydrolase of the HAD superfamily
MSPLKAVLFDIDDTLFSTTEFAARARRNAVRAMIQGGIRLPEDEVYQELKEVIAEFSSNYEHHYDKLLMRLPPEALGNNNPALVVAAGVVAYHDTKFEELEPFADVAPLLQALLSAGIVTGIVTHGWTTKQAEKLIRLQLMPLLTPSAIFISEQVGISKPNPKLYLAALRSLGLEADQVMYVGDNLVNDIAPPQGLGMHTTWARRAAHPGPDIDQFHPDHVVDDFRELGQILRTEYNISLHEEYAPED